MHSAEKSGKVVVVIKLRSIRRCGARRIDSATARGMREHLEREQLETTLRRVLREELDAGTLSGVHP